MKNIDIATFRNILKVWCQILGYISRVIERKPKTILMPQLSYFCSTLSRDCFGHRMEKYKGKGTHGQICNGHSFNQRTRKINANIKP